MSIWTKSKIKEALAGSPAKLGIQPLLTEGQINEVTIDLRLGYDFLVSVLTRDPSIDISANAFDSQARLSAHFQETRRELGTPFVLYPNQLVLVSTLEYISLPPNAYADVFPRSSYSKLGVGLGGMLQPGYRGCVPLELLNHGNVPVTLTVGSRICQIRIMDTVHDTNYHGQQEPRKYYGQVRPTVSKAAGDIELQLLKSIAKNLDA